MRFTTSTVSFANPSLSATTSTTPIDCLTVFSVSFVISYTNSGLTGTFVGEGSNDGTTWVTVMTPIAVASPTSIEIPATQRAFAAHRYYRISLAWTGGSASNVKVAVVTKGY